jgi:hypothetical protein
MRLSRKLVHHEPGLIVGESTNGQWSHFHTLEEAILTEISSFFFCETIVRLAIIAIRQYRHPGPRDFQLIRLHRGYCDETTQEIAVRADVRELIHAVAPGSPSDHCAEHIDDSRNAPNHKPEHAEDCSRMTKSQVPMASESAPMNIHYPPGPLHRMIQETWVVKAVCAAWNTSASSELGIKV